MMFIIYVKTSAKIDCIRQKEEHSTLQLDTISIYSRATVKIRSVHFFQTLCCVRRNGSSISSPPSSTGMSTEKFKITPTY